MVAKLELMSFLKDKPFSGREASVLALLAQSRSLPETDKRRILSTLRGKALKIAKVIVGDVKRSTKNIQTIANGFIDWAK